MKLNWARIALIWLVVALLMAWQRVVSLERRRRAKASVRRVTRDMLRARRTP